MDGASSSSTTRTARTLTPGHQPHRHPADGRAAHRAGAREQQRRQRHRAVELPGPGHEQRQRAGAVRAPCPTRWAPPAATQIAGNASLGSGPVALLSNGVLQGQQRRHPQQPAVHHRRAIAASPWPAATSRWPARPALTGNVTLSVNNTTTFNADLAGTSGLTMTSQPVIAGTTIYSGTGNLVITAPVSVQRPGRRWVRRHPDAERQRRPDADRQRQRRADGQPAKGPQRQLHADLQRSDDGPHPLQRDAGDHGVGHR